MIPENIKKYLSLQPFFPSLIPAVLANTLISMVISFPLFKYGNQQTSLFTSFINLISFTSHYFLLNISVGIIIFVLSFILHGRIMIFSKIILFFLLQVLLLIDTKIYSIFYYHLNSLVWNVITTEGAFDSVILGKVTIFIFSLYLLIIFLTELIINVKLANLYKNIKPERLPLYIKSLKVLFTVCICLIIVDKGIYAYGDIVNETSITKNARLYPLYQPFTIKRFASKVLHIEVNRELNFKMSNSNSMVKYPKQKLTFDSSKTKNYNIIVIVLDGFRFDMMNKDVTPNIWAFGQENLIYNNHYSGGNGTRFGIFTLLYGIHGSYWHNFLAQRISPIFIDTLIDHGYDFTILSATLLTFPEFRKTAFVKIPENIKDNFPGQNIPQKDELMTGEFINYISSRQSEKPFFAFLFYNSSHQSFHHPAEFKKFLPVSDREINYFKDIGKSNIHLLKNRYKNALYYEDYLLGKIIKELEVRSLLDNSIVIITGDHGEEFYENDFFGHTSSFDDYQLKTAFVLHYPRNKHQIIQRITSHLDVVPTLMDYLGCISPPENYSQGLSLLGSKTHNYITVANWDNAAIIDNELKIVYSTELYNIGSFEVRRKTDYTLVENARQLLKQKNSLLLDVLRKMSEFYKGM